MSKKTDPLNEETREELRDRIARVMREVQARIPYPELPAFVIAQQKK